MGVESMHPVLISDLLGIGEAYKHLFYTWFGLGIILITGLILKSRIKMVPSGLQNVLEVLIGGLESFAVTSAGEKARKFFPVLGGIFIYLLVLNLMGLVPGFDAPTANINTNLCMALFVFVLYNAVGIKTWGAGYIKHFMGPMKPLAPLMLPIEIVSHLVRPVSLTLRLFGNIRGEEIVLMLFFVMAPIFSTLPIYFLFLLAKVLQAFIFYMLTLIYLQGAYEHAH